MSSPACCPADPTPAPLSRTAIGAPNDNQRPPPAPFIGIERGPSHPTALTPCPNPKAAPHRWIEVKWKAGTLSVELTPATSFGGHHLDFIAQDGTLAETVAVDDATRTGDTFAWAVADAPWAAGDKIMVRLYREVSSTCTVAEGAMKPGACYQDPVFTGAPFSFTVSEDAAVGSAVAGAWR